MTDPYLLPLRIAERYGRLLLWVRQQGLPHYERDVLEHLVEAGDKNLSSWWSNPKIAKHLGCSTKTVQRAMKALEEKRLIYRKPQRAGEAQNPFHTTVLAPAELVQIRLNEQERRVDNHEPDVGEYRLPVRVDSQSTGGLDSESTEPSGLKEESNREVSEGSLVPQSTRPFARRRAAGPMPAADVFAQLGGFAA